jgi:5-methylcytosine-specific restriction endonuclease McrA
VSEAPAPDRGALAFAEKLLTVLAYGRKSATYKYAVLLGLVDLCHEQSTAEGTPPRSVPVAQLAEKVIELCWQHTLPFPDGAREAPRQNSGGRQMEILQRIQDFRERETRDATASRTRSRRRSPEAWARLVADVEWKLAEMPLPKFQRVGDRLDPFVYWIGWGDAVRRSEYLAGDRCLHFVGDAADHLVRLGVLLRPFVQREWARLVAQFNRESFPEADLESYLFGADRASSAALREPLREMQGGLCFYCGERLDSRFEVDHFVPWARHPDDGIENLVAADAGCNRAKRDHLAAADHVDGWVRRLGDRKEALAEIARDAQWESHPERTRNVARSIYTRLPDDAMLWKLGTELVALDRPRLVRAFAI